MGLNVRQYYNYRCWNFTNVVSPALPDKLPNKNNENNSDLSDFFFAITLFACSQQCTALRTRYCSQRKMFQKSRSIFDSRCDNVRRFIGWIWRLAQARPSF